MVIIPSAREVSDLKVSGVAPETFKSDTSQARGIQRIASWLSLVKCKIEMQLIS